MLEPINFIPEETTIWSFPNRGNWATHSGEYRGNWSPYIPRNLIIRYSRPGDWILDQFVGSGTTLIEAKLLNRNAIGIDINPSAISITQKNLQFVADKNPQVKTQVANATDLSFISSETVDFICTHPPYSDIIHYSSGLPGDISLLKDDDFFDELYKAACESYRVLKPGKFCAFMMGDRRIKGNVVPLGFRAMNCFKKAGFILKEIIIKEQHNCRSIGKWLNANRSFLLLAHEYIFVLYK